MIIKDMKPFISNEDLKETKGDSFFVGGRLFEVSIDHECILILKPRTELEFMWDNHYIEIIKEFNNFLGYWEDIGDRYGNNVEDTALIKIDKFNYVYLGKEIYSFETDEEILDYAAGKAYGKNCVYEMLDSFKMKNTVKNFTLIHGILTFPDEDENGNKNEE